MIGFNQSQYRLEESTTPYPLTIEVLSPPESLVETVELTLTAVNGAAISECYNACMHHVL